MAPTTRNVNRDDISEIQPNIAAQSLDNPITANRGAHELRQEISVTTDAFVTPSRDTPPRSHSEDLDLDDILPRRRAASRVYAVPEGKEDIPKAIADVKQYARVLSKDGGPIRMEKHLRRLLDIYDTYHVSRQTAMVRMTITTFDDALFAEYDQQHGESDIETHADLIAWIRHEFNLPSQCIQYARAYKQVVQTSATAVGFDAYYGKFVAASFNIRSIPPEQRELYAFITGLQPEHQTLAYAILSENVENATLATLRAAIKIRLSAQPALNLVHRPASDRPPRYVPQSPKFSYLRVADPAPRSPPAAPFRAPRSQQPASSKHSRAMTPSSSTANSNQQLQKLSDEDRKRLDSEGSCYKCRQPGHFARDCPTGRPNGRAQ